MPQEEIGRKQDQTDQTSTWFQNRGLFSDHFLQAHLPEWKEWKVDAELVPFRNSLLSLYESKKSILPYLKEAQTEDEFIKPVLDLLGYIDSYIVQAPTKLGQHTNRPDYALFPDVKTKNKAYQKLDQNNYSLCIGIADAKYWERELDLAKSSDRDTFTNQNPSFQIAGYLTGTKRNWGILTNGRLWRLYSSKSHLPLGNYYQVDIVHLVEQAPVETLKYFYVLFRKQALLLVEGKSLLDRILEGSEEYAVELEADIKERAYDVVELLCRGFAADFTREQLTDAALKSIYDNSLTLLYRLLFVFYAEARELLPLTTSASYRENYSLRKLTHDIDEILKKGYELSTSSTQYYNYISNLFRSINDGDRKLGVPEYNGGLFNPVEHPFLEKQAIPDAYLLRAIHQLARITDRQLKCEVAVDYNTLSERHLGSIYEGLLEFKPMVAPHDLVVIKDKGSVKYAPADKHPGKKVAYTKDELHLANDKGERKASGSYYTPEYIVNYIVENTLDPLVEEAHEKARALKIEVDKAIEKWQKLKEQKEGSEPAEKYDRKIAQESERLLQPYLSLKVLDPAMGSGHFLARATDFLAEAIATDPDIESPLELTEESELTYYRRRVVESCIYGVDLNPLAVELAKLTLWLTTMAKSKPLSFLNHHLRVGNSLIGARVADLDEIPKDRRKKKAIDLSRAPVQLGLFEQAFNRKLYDLLQNRALIAQLPNETLEDVRNKQKWEKDFEHNMERFRTLADVWVSTFFGSKVAWDEYNTLVENLQSSAANWKKLIEKKYMENSLNLRENYRFFHWELEFPEVFYDEQGNRNHDSGFDAVVGNPPYGYRFDSFEAAFVSSSYERVAYREESYVAFMEKSFSLLNRSGLASFIVPDNWMYLDFTEKLRVEFVSSGALQSIVALPRTVFPEATVDTCIYVISKAEHSDIRSNRTLVVAYDKRDLITRIDSDRGFYQAQKYWLSSYGHIINPHLAPSEVQILEKAANLSVRLEDVCYIGYGLKAYQVGKGKPVQTAETLRTRPFTSSEKKSGAFYPFFEGESISRYETLWCDDKWIRWGPWLAEPRGEGIFVGPRLLFRKVVGTRLIGNYVQEKAYSNTLLYVLRAQEHLQLDLNALLACLNSSVIGFIFRKMYAIREDDTFPQILLDDMASLPIRRINFTTPEKERKQLLEQAKRLYQEYLHSLNWDKILSFVSERLPTKEDGTPDVEHEQSDVVHDLLAFLAEEMTRLNKEKRSKIKHFLTWLEKEILKGSIEDQKNKTKIRNFHEGTLEQLMDVLKKNKVIPDPCPSNTWDTVSGAFSTAVNALTPLKAYIAATDKLIDQMVYKLYGLNEDEIAIVEGGRPT